MTKQSVPDNQMWIFLAVAIYLNYILRLCMVTTLCNYSYSYMTSGSLIRVVSCIDMPDTPGKV